MSPTLSVAFTATSFTACTATYGGGAFVVSATSAFSFVFAGNNLAQLGGGLFVASASSRFTSSTFQNNTAASQFAASRSFVNTSDQDASPYFSWSSPSFDWNVAGGGAVFVTYLSSAVDCTFTNNFAYAAVAPGSIDASAAANTSVSIIGSHALGAGMLVFAMASDGFITRSIWRANTASCGGNCVAGASLFIITANTSGSMPAITDCTFTASQSAAYASMSVQTTCVSACNLKSASFCCSRGPALALGAALYVHYASDLTISGCSFSSSSAFANGVVIGAAVSGGHWDRIVLASNIMAGNAVNADAQHSHVLGGSLSVINGANVQVLSLNCSGSSVYGQGEACMRCQPALLVQYACVTFSKGNYTRILGGCIFFGFLTNLSLQTSVLKNNSIYCLGASSYCNGGGMNIHRSSNITIGSTTVQSNAVATRGDFSQSLGGGFGIASVLQSLNISGVDFIGNVLKVNNVTR